MSSFEFEAILRKRDRRSSPLTFHVTIKWQQSVKIMQYSLVTDLLCWLSAAQENKHALGNKGRGNRPRRLVHAARVVVVPHSHIAVFARIQFHEIDEEFHLWHQNVN